MVKLKFIIRDKVLVLRISEGKNRYYKRVGHLLKGQPNLQKHWNAEKECFSSYAVRYQDNNKALEQFKEIYWKAIQRHPESNAKQIAAFYKTTHPKTSLPNADLPNWTEEECNDSISKYLQVVILREKAKRGCNYECYHKLLAKCRRVLPGFENMTFSRLDYNSMVNIAYIFAQSKSYHNTSKTFRALLGKASRDSHINFKLSQIGDFRFSDYNPNKDVVVEKHPDILTAEQLKTFLNISVQDITPTYRDRQDVELYYDFCVFMYYSFFAPCDVIKVKVRDITNRETLLVKRKKTHRSVEVPITPTMRQIINKYRGKSKDGYIFPILDDEKEKQYKVKDYTFKKFREKVNKWLKPVGEMLGVKYNLYAYVFRHTAITTAINNGLPVSYVANVAGTSVDIIQAHYYNGNSKQNREKLTQALMQASL